MARTLVLTGIMALICSSCSLYGGPREPAARAPASRPASRPAPTATASIALSASQVALVREYFGGGTTTAHGHGRGRDGGLPPGIAKNLRRGKSLPPGIAKQALPRDLLVRLPATPGGLEYLVVAGKLLLVETATQVVRDVLLETVFG